MYVCVQAWLSVGQCVWFCQVHAAVYVLRIRSHFSIPFSNYSWRPSKCYKTHTQHTHTHKMAGAEDIWKYYFHIFLSRTKDRVTCDVVSPCTPIKQQFPDSCKMLWRMGWSHVATTITWRSISTKSKTLVVDYHDSNMDIVRMGQMDEHPEIITASADV